MRIASASPFLCETIKRFLCPYSYVSHHLSQHERISPCDLCARVFHNVFAHAYFNMNSLAHIFTSCFCACVLHHAISAHAYFTTFSCACALQHEFMNTHFLPRVSCACVHQIFFSACALHYVVLRMCTSPRVPAHASFTKCCRVNRVVLRYAIAHIVPHMPTSPHGFVHVDFTPVVLLMWTSPRGFAYVDFTTWFCSCRLHHMVLFMWTSPRGFAHVDFTTWLYQSVLNLVLLC
jgi:hypothetical protein